MPRSARSPSALDAPVTGRVFFEHIIRDNLDGDHPGPEPARGGPLPAVVDAPVEDQPDLVGAADRVTNQGLRTAMFLTRVHDRLLPTGLAQQADPHTQHRLQTAATTYQRALDAVAEQNGLAA